MLTRDGIYNYISALNGGNQISVELTKDTEVVGVPSDLDTIITKATEVYNKYRPKVNEFPFIVIKNQQNYNLPRTIVGRGVLRYIPRQSISDSYKQFPSSYYPVNYPGYNIKAADLIGWRGINATERKILGSWDDWKYNQDNNTLTIYPPPLQSFNGVLETLHDRMFAVIQNIFTTTQGQREYPVKLVNENRLPVVNIVPGSISIKIGTWTIVDDYSGNLSCSDPLVGGTIDYSKGIVTVIFTDIPPQGLSAALTICEIRQEDYNWFKDYALAIGKIIIGRKRSHFGGKIPGAQKEIELDVDVLKEGNEEKEKLEDTAKVWMLSWAIPRTQ
jgi:hypothetical protein